MTTDQEAEDVAASVRHLLTQRGKDAENWRRQSQDWEARCGELRTQVDDLTEILAELRATISDLRTQRLRLERKAQERDAPRVSSTDAAHEPAQKEETRV